MMRRAHSGPKWLDNPYNWNKIGTVTNHLSMENVFSPHPSMNLNYKSKYYVFEGMMANKEMNKAIFKYEQGKDYKLLYFFRRIGCIHLSLQSHNPFILGRPSRQRWLLMYLGTHIHIRNQCIIFYTKRGQQYIRVFLIYLSPKDKISLSLLEERKKSSIMMM